MKYWRGYLVALIVAACAFALRAFAATHSVLVDMIYPYVSRMAISFLSGFTVGKLVWWQLFLLVLAIAIVVYLIICIVRRRNPVRFIGWTMAFISVLFLLHTGIYGLNQYAGTLSDDIRMEKADYSVPDMQNALVYFQNHANDLAAKLPRDKNGDPIADFDTLANNVTAGFHRLSDEEYYSVFACSDAPVKKLGWGFVYSLLGKTGQLFPITGEAAVNAATPAAGLPFAMCRVLANRVCIESSADSAFAAYLACIASNDPLTQYSGYFMAYRYCYEALKEMPGGAISFRDRENSQLKHDFDTYNKSFAARADDPTNIVKTDAGTIVTNAADILVSWHLQVIVKPLNAKEETTFDPMDETQVDLSGLPNAKVEEKPEETVAK